MLTIFLGVFSVCNHVQERKRGNGALGWISEGFKTFKSAIQQVGGGEFCDGILSLEINRSFQSLVAWRLLTRISSNFPPPTCQNVGLKVLNMKKQLKLSIMLRRQ
ncbi:hypothetical protein TorRG33x02_357890 [Trema orientale]|uniref:Uncharacterized protein n=1 Tax=Trema orientale TaxID=63057 RepID=A0A2P5A4I8_TREOI|nr:hypothetical protein TorRG33x02_357890 [Trema orientale]